MSKNRFQFNISLGDDDRKIIKELQEQFSVNVSHFLKLALKQRLAELNGIQVLLKGTKPRK